MLRLKERDRVVVAIGRQDIPICICPCPLNTTAICVGCVRWVASGQKGWILWGISKRIKHSKPKIPYQLTHPSSQIGSCKHRSRIVRQICIVRVCVRIHSGSKERIGEAAFVHYVNDRFSGRDKIPWLSARGNSIFSIRKIFESYLSDKETEGITVV